MDDNSSSEDSSSRPIAEEAAAIAGHEPDPESNSDPEADATPAPSDPDADATPAPPEPSQLQEPEPHPLRDASSERDSELAYPYTDSDDVDGSVSIEDWGAMFPYDEPYDDQEEAISRILTQLDHERHEEGGITLLEAACGTGKTLISLDDVIPAIRDSSTKYENAVVTTNVHQQIKAFEDDIEAINENLPDDVEPVSAISMVGKGNLCSYTDAGIIDPADIYTQCDRLREPPRMAAQASSAEESLEKMTNDAMATATEDTLQTAGWESPYNETLPTTGDGTEYCPFYSEYRRRGESDDEDDSYNFSGVMRPEELMEHAAEEGLCPHAVLIEAIENAEVVIGNYKHIMDPVTVEAMTDTLIGPESILICDEAHNLVPESREELSDEVAHTTLKRAVEEIRTTILQLDGDAGREMDRALSAYRVDDDELVELAEMLEALLEEIRDRTVAKLDSIDSNWHDDQSAISDEISVALRDPETVEQDELTDWFVDSGYERLLERAAKIEQAVTEGFDEAQRNSDFHRNETYTDTVARVLKRWWQNDHAEYFRELTISKLEHERNGDMGFEDYFTTSITLRNCIPAEEIAARIDTFGAAILMSATLEPLSAYRETIGADVLEANGRDVQTLTYGLSYPEENRFSAALPLPKYTSTNRGDPGNGNEIRQKYLSAISTVAKTTPGNIMVAMPNYEEARWAADRLDTHPAISKPVRADGSDVDSDELKEWFYSNGDKILTTGLRGTLTEGVDFDGDKLRGCIVCGVPLRSLGGNYPDAIEKAYQERFGSNNGFDYAFTIPAIRKARQALGRVIRGTDETGVRVLADRRYASTKWDHVREYLPEYERQDYTPSRSFVDEITQFWEGKA